MKALVIGDLHAKTTAFARIINHTKDLGDPYDRIIFVGDACDDWLATIEDNLEMLDMLAATKKHYGDKFIWLLGNHDWAYYDPSIPISGHMLDTDDKVKNFLKEHIQDWSIVYEEEGHLFSHAGVCVDFLRHPLLLSPKHPEFLDSINKLKYQPEYYNPLNSVGLSCGGQQTPSPLWLRPKDISLSHLTPLTKYKQVIGHTPVPYIQFQSGMLMVDTFSTYPNMLPIGNSATLIIETDGGNEKLYQLTPDGEQEEIKEKQWHVQ